MAHFRFPTEALRGGKGNLVVEKAGLMVAGIAPVLQAVTECRERCSSQILLIGVEGLMSQEQHN